MNEQEAQEMIRKDRQSLSWKKGEIWMTKIGKTGIVGFFLVPKHCGKKMKTVRCFLGGTERASEIVCLKCGYHMIHPEWL